MDTEQTEQWDDKPVALSGNDYKDILLWLYGETWDMIMDSPIYPRKSQQQRKDQTLLQAKTMLLGEPPMAIIKQQQERTVSSWSTPIMILDNQPPFPKSKLPDRMASSMPIIPFKTIVSVPKLSRSLISWSTPVEVIEAARAEQWCHKMMMLIASSKYLESHAEIKQFIIKVICAYRNKTRREMFERFMMWREIIHPPIYRYVSITLLSSCVSNMIILQ
jgi:hypothetical protein